MGTRLEPTNSVRNEDLLTPIVLIGLAPSERQILHASLVREGYLPAALRALHRMPPIRARKLAQRAFSGPSDLGARLLLRLPAYGFGRGHGRDFGNARSFGRRFRGDVVRNVGQDLHCNA